MNKYDSYRDSGIEWIGEIPEHWRKARLANNGIFLKGKGVSKSDLTPEGTPVILYGDIYTKYGIKTKIVHRRIPQGVAENSVEIHKGDLLFTASGETAEEIGKCVCYIGDIVAYAGGDVIIYRQEKNNSIFLSYLFNSYKINELKAKASKGEIVVHIYSSQLRDIYFPRPPLSEQTAIVTYLERKTAKLDELIADKKRILLLYEEERTAIINQTVTKGIDLEVPLKDSGIEWLGEIPEHWEVKKLKYLSQINPLKNSAFKELDEKVVFLPMEKVGEDGSYDCQLRKPIVDLWNGFTYFEKGDILVAKITPCFENGKGAYLSNLATEFGFGSTEFHVLRATIIYPHLLYYITRSEIFMKIGESSMTGAAGQKRVPTSFVSEFIFAFPPKSEEQCAIVRHIETKCANINAKKEKTQKLIELLTEYRTALISEVVTGKIKVIE